MTSDIAMQLIAILEKTVSPGEFPHCYKRGVYRSEKYGFFFDWREGRALYVAQGCNRRSHMFGC